MQADCAAVIRGVNLYGECRAEVAVRGAALRVRGAGVSKWDLEPHISEWSSFQGMTEAA